MLWLVLLKMRLARIAFAKRRAYITLARTVDTLEEQYSYLVRDLFLVFSRKIDEMVIFCAHEKGNGRLVEAPSLPVPFFDGVQSAFPSEIEHEEDSYGVVANQGKHVDELSLTTEIPNRKGDLGVAN